MRGKNEGLLVKSNVPWVGEWVRSRVHSRWAEVKGVSERGVILREGSRASEVGIPVCRSRMCSRRTSVHGSEDLMKGKECTRREEAERRGNKPLLTHFYSLEKCMLVVSTNTDEQIKV